MKQFYKKLLEVKQCMEQIFGRDFSEQLQSKKACFPIAGISLEREAVDRTEMVAFMST